VEFIRAPFEPKIPSHMKVKSCIAGIWRVRSNYDGLRLRFQTRLTSKREGIPETGEGLMSVGFHDKINLSIGTEDEDFLQQRASNGKWMPIRVKDMIKADDIHFIHGGLEVNLPLLAKCEMVQIQFIVAWASKDYPEVTPWFAVEQSPGHILNAIG
jgi:hypothetical protein